MKILIAVNRARVLYDFKRELASALAARGDELVFSFVEDFRTPFFAALGRVVPAPLDSRGTSPTRDWRLFRHYRRLLRAERPDLVLTFTVKPNVYCGLACRLARIPYLGTISGTGSAAGGGGALGRLTTFLYRLGLRGATRVFSQNRSLDAWLVDERIARRERIVPVLGSGVDLKRFQYAEYPPDDGTTRFLFIGRLLPDKGLVELLEAAEQICSERFDVVFQIVGAPERRCDVSRLVYDASRAGIVEYLGYQEDVRPTIRAASATILPSYREGMSNALLESGALGRPLLASNVPGCAETFDDGVTGFGFEPRDVDSLVAAIERFLALSYSERREMGLRSRRKIEKSFDRGKVVARYLAEIAAVAAESRR